MNKFDAFKHFRPGDACDWVLIRAGSACTNRISESLQLPEHADYGLQFGRKCGLERQLLSVSQRSSTPSREFGRIHERIATGLHVGGVRATRGTGSAGSRRGDSSHKLPDSLSTLLHLHWQSRAIPAVRQLLPATGSEYSRPWIETGGGGLARRVLGRGDQYLPVSELLEHPVLV